MLIPLFMMALPAVLVALVYWWIVSRGWDPWKPELILVVFSVLWSIVMSPLPDYYIGIHGPGFRFEVDEVLFWTAGVVLLTPVLICFRPWHRKARIAANKPMRAAFLAIWCAAVLGSCDWEEKGNDWYLRGFVEWVGTHVDVAVISEVHAEGLGLAPAGGVKEHRPFKRLPQCDSPEGVELDNARVLVMQWGHRGPNCGLLFDPTDSYDMSNHGRTAHIAPGVWAWSDAPWEP